MAPFALSLSKGSMAIHGTIKQTWYNVALDEQVLQEDDGGEEAVLA